MRHMSLEVDFQHICFVVPSGQGKHFLDKLHKSVLSSTSSKFFQPSLALIQHSQYKLVSRPFSNNWIINHQVMNCLAYTSPSTLHPPPSTPSSPLLSIDRYIVQTSFVTSFLYSEPDCFPANITIQFRFAPQENISILRTSGGNRWWHGNWSYRMEWKFVRVLKISCRVLKANPQSNLF